MDVTTWWLHPDGQQGPSRHCGLYIVILSGSRLPAALQCTPPVWPLCVAGTIYFKIMCWLSTRNADKMAVAAPTGLSPGPLRPAPHRQSFHAMAFNGRELTRPQGQGGGAEGGREGAGSWLGIGANVPGYPLSHCPHRHPTQGFAGLS